jgi:hypothetical protein
VTAPLSTEPFAIAGNGEVVRVGTRVLYSAGLFTVAEIGRADGECNDCFVMLVPIDDRAVYRAKLHGVLPGDLVRIYARDVCPEGTPVRYIQ